MAGIAAPVGVIAGGQLYLYFHVKRRDNFGVTLYSEPNYRGTRVTLPCLPRPHNVLLLSRHVGSIRVQRFTDRLVPAF